MIEFLNTDNLFSADKRNQSPSGQKLAKSITLEDLTNIGQNTDENKIDIKKIAKLQADIFQFLNNGPLP